MHTLITTYLNGTVLEKKCKLCRVSLVVLPFKYGTYNLQARSDSSPSSYEAHMSKLIRCIFEATNRTTYI